MKDRELQPRPTWLCVTRHDWTAEAGADPESDLLFSAGNSIAIISGAPGGRLAGEPPPDVDEPQVGIFPACMVERGPEHERSAATHNGWGTGTLRSGRSKKKVTSRKQAIAIGLSEARAKGRKVPKKASKTTVKKRKTAKKRKAAKKR